jgi:Zinc-binding domain of primase-helicase
VSERAVPFHCPYCGGEDLWPHADGEAASAHGTWECRACLRAFSLKLIGLLRPAASPPEAGR